MSYETKRILVVQSPYYQDVAAHLKNGALDALRDQGISQIDVVNVAGALEIPAAVAMGAKSGHYDAYVVLGCVIRGETSHYDIVAGESARKLMDLSTEQGLIIGNAILTCETREQAIVRADPAQKNKGADAVSAVISLFEIQNFLDKK